MAGTDSTRPHAATVDRRAGPAIILVEPQLGENIGAVARAMLNCGLSDLRLVRPREDWPNEKARAAAAGADLVIDPTQEDAGLLIKQRTGSMGVDVSLETSGSYAALNDALRSTKYRGTVLSSAFYTSSVQGLALAGEWHRNRIHLISSRANSEPQPEHGWDFERIVSEALALLVGCSVAHRQRGAPAQGTSPREYHRATGIFFEVNGDLGGGVVLLLGPESRDRVVRSFLGVGREGDIDPDTAFSAVCELGNIVASRAISAVADTLGARILLSLPNLATESAEVVLERWITERRRHGPVLHFEIELADIEGSFQALLVFVLDL